MLGDCNVPYTNTQLHERPQSVHFHPQRLSVTTAIPLHKSPLRDKSQLKTPTHFEHFSGYFRTSILDVLYVFLTRKTPHTQAVTVLCPPVCRT